VRAVAGHYASLPADSAASTPRSPNDMAVDPPRVEDPRYTGTVQGTQRAFHATADSMYGREVAGKVLGARARQSLSGR